MTSSRLPRWIAVVFLLLACVLAAPAVAQEQGFSDELRTALERQDRLAAEEDWETLLAEAERRVEKEKDETRIPDAWYLLGRAHGNLAMQARARGDEETHRDELAAAEVAFGRAKEEAGLLYPPAHLGLARVMLMREEMEQATQELESALAIAPEFREAVLELAQVLWVRGLQRDAEFRLRAFLEKHPDDLAARLLLGRFKMARKRWPEAEAEFAAVVRKDPGNTTARKMLATVLAFQNRYEEAAVELEIVRKEEPKSDDVYTTLFHVYRKMGRLDAAKALLKDMVRELPGTRSAELAQSLLEQIEKDPEAWENPGGTTRQDLVDRLDSDDQAVVAKALREMVHMAWPALPAGVYRHLSTSIATEEVRLAAVDLIGHHADDRTLPILEILLAHEQERDPSTVVRRAAAQALAKLPTAGTLFVLYEALDDPDVGIREAAVKGIAGRTGKWFRAELGVRTSEADWPAERERYTTWWQSGSAAVAKRECVRAMERLYAQITGGRRRVASYLVHALGDRNPKTWRAGYDLMLDWLEFTSFGHETGTPDAAARAQVAADARSWFADDLRKAREAAERKKERENAAESGSGDAPESPEAPGSEE